MLKFYPGAHTPLSAHFGKGRVTILDDTPGKQRSFVALAMNPDEFDLLGSMSEWPGRASYSRSAIVSERYVVSWRDRRFKWRDCGSAMVLEAALEYRRLLLQASTSEDMMRDAYSDIKITRRTIIEEEVDL